LSRTPKRGKPPGYDYWSRRPMAGQGPAPGVKQATHQIERARAKDEVRKQQAESTTERDGKTP
jgi:hypothetical protein